MLRLILSKLELQIHTSKILGVLSTEQKHCVGANAYGWDRNLIKKSKGSLLSVYL